MDKMTNRMDEYLGYFHEAKQAIEVFFGVDPDFSEKTC